MGVTDLELVEGRHYHAWALMPSMYTFTTGRTMTQLVYSASKQPHADRGTAHRHAKQMAEPEYGSGGYMALLCGGGEACPYTFQPWEPSFLKVEDAFNLSGAKAILTPHHTAAEGGGNDNPAR